MKQDETTASLADATGGNILCLQLDWTSTAGCLVELRHQFLPARSGLVEAVTANGAILWLAAEGAMTRALFEKSEGYEIWMSWRTAC